MVQNPVIDAESVAVAVLERLWHATTVGAKRGDIGKFDNELIAEECGWLGEADELIRLFIECGYLDECTEHRLIVHDWSEHAPKHVKGAVKKMGGFLIASYDPRGPTLEEPPLRDRPPNPTKPNPTNSNPTQPPAGTTDWDELVVVVSDLGLVKAEDAIAKAKQLHSLETVQEIINHWRCSPPSDPGTLFNWLSVKNSFRPVEANTPQPRRKDPKLEWEKVRARLHRAGTEAGMRPEAIDEKLAEKEAEFFAKQLQAAEV